MTSAKELTIPQLEELVKYFKRLGFRPIKARWLKPHDARSSDDQVIALWKRAREIAADLPGGTVRLQGLVKKICGVEILEWCRDEDKLERLLRLAWARLPVITRCHAALRRGGPSRKCDRDSFGDLPSLLWGLRIGRGP